MNLLRFLGSDFIYAEIEGVYDQIPVTEKSVYVQGTLKIMFKNSELCDIFLQAKQQEEGTYKDICDGSYFKSDDLFFQAKTCIQ